MTIENTDPTLKCDDPSADSVPHLVVTITVGGNLQVDSFTSLRQYVPPLPSRLPEFISTTETDLWEQ